MAGSDRKVIIFHHETDKKYLEKLRVHLRPLEKKYLIEVWNTTSILPGAVRHAETQQALSTAKVAILLIVDEIIKYPAVNIYPIAIY